MPWIKVQTPSRLHLGLLSWGGTARREFGGVGLMINAPGIQLRGAKAGDWSADGPLADRVLFTAQQVAERLGRLGWEVPPIRFEVSTAPAEHVGLGVGTQLGMAVARVITEWVGMSDLPAVELGRLAGRGRRSGIGVHGFALGGLIVDGGRRRGGPEIPPPLLARLAWPPSWHVLVVIPPDHAGLHGSGEAHAFQTLAPPSESIVDRLGRLVLLGLLPSIAEAHLEDFDATLGEIQTLIGQGFAAVQGGIYASEEGADLARLIGSLGLRGVGQSSWGPTVYGFSNEPDTERRRILDLLRRKANLAADQCFWTSGATMGAQLLRSEDAED